jgi:hypothetical protein
MSDGPHRSLPMRRGWKRVAECGDNRAFAPEEVAEAIIPALEQDCRAEMPEQLLDATWRVFCGREPSLFEVQIVPELEALREMAGTGIGRVIVEHAILAAARGKTGKEGLIEAVTNARADRVTKGARHVEEHYLRKSTASRSQRVRARIEEGAGRAAIDGLARRMLKVGQETYSRPMMRDGLDDGVRF